MSHSVQRLWPAILVERPERNRDRRHFLGPGREGIQYCLRPVLRNYRGALRPAWNYLIWTSSFSSPPHSVGSKSNYTRNPISIERSSTCDHRRETVCRFEIRFYKCISLLGRLRLSSPHSPLPLTPWVCNCHVQGVRSFFPYTSSFPNIPDEILVLDDPRTRPPTW